MKLSVKLVLGIAFLSILVQPAFALGFGKLLDGPSPPDLSYPTKEELDLSGLASLEFKWYIHELMSVSYCEFRLYKGYYGADSELILKEKVFSPDHTFTVGVSQFAGGKVYTWTVRAVAYDGQKSDLSSQSFRVIGK